MLTKGKLMSETMTNIYNNNWTQLHKFGQKFEK